MMGPYWYGGNVWSWPFMLLNMALWVGAIALGVYLVARAGRAGLRAGEQREKPIEVLQRRYAAGEINAEDYQKMKEELKRE